jgi:hypothetical protein
MPKKVTFDVTANTKGAQKGLSNLGKTSGVLAGILSKLGPVGSGISSVLDKLGVKNIDAAAGFGIATAAIGASVAIGERAMDMYVKLGDRIRTYANVTGESADQASRQVQAFDALGVNADVAAAGMFKLAKAANTHAKDLEALGIQIARNKDGTVDLNATLLNAINAYQATGDAAKRDAIILAAFGKSGAAMIPVLETNIAQLKRLQAEVGKVYTQKDLDNIKAYTIAQKEAQHSADEWSLSLGQFLLPKTKAVYDSLNENVYVAKHLDERLIKLTGSTNGTRAAMTEADRELRAEWAAAQSASVAIDELAAAQVRAADAAKAEADAEDTLYNAIHKNLDSHFAYRQALLDLKKAQKDATDAKGKDAEANLRLEEAIFNVSDAALAQAQAQAALSGQTLTTAQEVDVQVGSLKKLEKGLDPKSPLRKEIDAYIRQLQGIPADVSTNVTFTGTVGGKGGAARVHRASGGPVSAGSVYTVGEQGPETLVMGNQGGSIIPNGAGSGSGGVHLHIHGGMFMDHGPTIDAISNALLRYARHRPGS